MSKRARYVTTGYLALAPQAFGHEYAVAGPSERKPYEEVGDIAVVHIEGPLEQHPSWFWQDYETIHEVAEAAFTSSSKAVALCINSPGGAAAGCFELARALRAMSEETGKPLGVFVDGMAASAAYAIACSATAGIHAPPTSTVASLAVFEALIDQTAMDQAMGVAFTFVPSTGADLKLTGNVHVKPTEAQLAHTQGQVDLLTSYFYALVEEMRGVPEGSVRALRGATLLASQGVANGLVDNLSGWSDFVAYLDSLQGKIPMGIQAAAAKKAEKAESEEEAKSPFEEMLTSLARHAESEDEATAKKAKRAIAALAADDYDGDEEKKDGAEGSKAEEEDKEPPKAAAAAAATPGAMASADALALVKRVHELEVRDARRAEDAERASLLATRPDFSAQVRKSLESASLDFVKRACKEWPKVSADPGAAAAAATPQTTPGAADGARAPLTTTQQALLDRMGKRGPQATSAKVVGSSLVLESMTREAAQERLKEMQAQGISPSGNGLAADLGRLTTARFKTPAAK